MTALVMRMIWVKVQALAAVIFIILVQVVLVIGLSSETQRLCIKASKSS